MKSSIINIQFSILLVSCMMVISCKKFIEVPNPSTVLIKQTVFESNETANAAMLGIFAQLEAGGILTNITTIHGFSSDEFINYYAGSDNTEINSNKIVPVNGRILSLWSELYQVIYQCNAVIEGLKQSSAIDSKLRSQLNGEAKFVRSFAYYYLSCDFGDVPLVEKTSYEDNISLPRMSKDSVYKFIVKDLLEAQNELREDYVGSDGIRTTSERFRPNRTAATALLSKIYLLGKEYSKSIELANAIISDSRFEIQEDLNKVFLRNGKENLLQITNDLYINTLAGIEYILMGAPSSQAMNSRFAKTFDETDLRYINWVGKIQSGNDTYYYPYKYKVYFDPTPIESYSLLRLAEIYLIRAEAFAEIEEFDKCAQDLNVLRDRAGLDPLQINDKPSAIHHVSIERSHELFAENGSRWLDIKRMNLANEIMSIETPYKGGIWESTAQLYPIPQTERNKNRNLSQNEGY